MVVGGVLGVTTHLLSGSLPGVRGPFLLHPGCITKHFRYLEWRYSPI